MKKDSTGISSETYKKHLDFQPIGNLAVRKAQAENRRPGLPNVYSRNGKIIFEMANGELIVKKANEK